MSAHLLDTNLLIALAWPQHVHHAKAHEWFQGVGHGGWTTCPLTQAVFTRISSNPKIIADAVTPRAALQVLQKNRCDIGASLLARRYSTGRGKTLYERGARRSSTSH